MSAKRTRLPKPIPMAPGSPPTPLFDFALKLLPGEQRVVKFGPSLKCNFPMRELL
jgi:hypothetical protein